jgi:DNA-3-methyladenine glycosylase II
MNKKVLSHFKKVDPLLYQAIEKLGEIKPYQIRNSGDYFSDLCEAIVGQQLSGRAADTIWGRFKELFPKKKVTPKEVLKISEDEMRKAGMSYAKARSVRDLAAKVEAGELEIKKLDKLTDKEIMEQLIKVKGIGPWTAEMFLMFTLGREDIFSHGDLALVKAIKQIYKLENPTRDQIEEIVIKWSPYRSYACRTLWRSLETKIIQE